MLPVARKPVSQRIRDAYEEFLEREGRAEGQREIARRFFGDAEKWRQFGRYMKKDAPQPRIGTAVRLALTLEKPMDEFIDDPLVEIAQELSEAREARESFDRRLGELEQAVAALPTAADLTRGFRRLQESIDSLASPGMSAARTAKSG